MYVISLHFIICIFISHRNENYVINKYASKKNIKLIMNSKYVYKNNEDIIIVRKSLN